MQITNESTNKKTLFLMHNNKIHKNTDLCKTLNECETQLSWMQNALLRYLFIAGKIIVRREEKHAVAFLPAKVIFLLAVYKPGIACTKEHHQMVEV